LPDVSTSLIEPAGGEEPRFAVEAPWSLDHGDVVKRLHSSADCGLSTAEADRRQADFGLNLLPEEDRITWPKLLLRQFTDVLIGILVVAAAISFMVGETTDGLTILAIITLNGALGFLQEWKAEKAIAALRSMLSPTCEVLRDGKETLIEASRLVPGDIVLLDAGSRVPADLRLLESVELKLDESALTGESLPVTKSPSVVLASTPLAERASMVWTGTAATDGRGIGIVVATGGRTEFGRIASLTRSVNTDATPLQRKLGVLGRRLGAIAIGISILVFLVGWYSGKPWIEMFLTSVSLAVAVVPEGLPAVVTLTMALGIRSMARRRALLRRLQAAEGLGAATVICTDKTGTLTQNEMTVTRLWLPSGELEATGIGYDPAGHFEQHGSRVDHLTREDLRRLLTAAIHCNHAALTQDDSGRWTPHGAPTESALVVAAHKAWLPPQPKVDVEAEFLFNSQRKRMSIVERASNGHIAYTKGAPEIVLERCTELMDGNTRRSLTASDAEQIEEVIHRYAMAGLRTLAIAEHPLSSSQPLDEETVERGLTLLGILGMLDPPRAEVPAAVAMTKTAGIRVFMITGDASDTALAIARKVGLDAVRAITGSQLDAMTDSELALTLKDPVVFARTAPEHKLRLVQLLQADGQIVAMTGDGVNDAPALKQSDVGIAMGNRGTDVAKNASDIVLTDDNFSSIVGAIEEGRRQFDNIQKFVRYLLSSNTGELVAIAGCLMLGGPLILLPVQILWMNLVTDGVTAVALGVEPAESNVMRRPPRDPKSRILDWVGFTWIVVLGAYMGGIGLLLFNHYLSDPDKAVRAQTIAFTALILVEKANVLNFRSLSQSIVRSNPLGNPWIYVAILVMVLLQVAAVYMPILQEALHTVPLTAEDWLVVVALAIPVLPLGELLKAVLGRLRIS
jgi:Ca2+-transporting ATPase